MAGDGDNDPEGFDYGQLFDHGKALIQAARGHAEEIDRASDIVEFLRHAERPPWKKCFDTGLHIAGQGALLGLGAAITLFLDFTSRGKIDLATKADWTHLLVLVLICLPVYLWSRVHKASR